MKLHHDKHHQAYVTNLNGAIEKHPDLAKHSAEDLLRNLNSVPEDVRTVVRNNGGGHVNHTMFWTIMKPSGGGEPTGRIAEQIRETGRLARRDDWFILFLSGHGAAREKGEDGYLPGSFFYVCADSDLDKSATLLTSRQLYEILAEIKCRKLLILDTCHSGDVASNPVRDLMRDGIAWLIFSSCDPKQQSNEPAKGIGRVRHGFFTECILETIKPAANAGGRRRLQLITAGQVVLQDDELAPQLVRNDADMVGSGAGAVKEKADLGRRQARLRERHVN